MNRASKSRLLIRVSLVRVQVGEPKNQGLATTQRGESFRNCHFVPQFTEERMPNVYVEPRPKGRPEGTAITDYILEFANGVPVTNHAYATQQAAVDAAKAMGHHPLVSRVRHTDKGKPDQWRPG